MAALGSFWIADKVWTDCSPAKSNDGADWCREYYPGEE